MRICGDYKLTINHASPTDPLTLIDELFANLSSGTHFSKLKLSNAYLQLPQDQESKKYVTFNAHIGLYQYHQLPFGFASAPGIFQCCMETLLQGLNDVSIYSDDLLITGTTLKIWTNLKKF